MKQITLTIKDDKKIGFLIELLEQFDFIELKDVRQKHDDGYDLFASAGIWKNRDIKAEDLRKRAWKRSH